MAEPAYTSVELAPLLLKNFTYVNILDYCQLLNDVHKCENNYNSVILKGQTLFKDGFVSDIRFFEEGDGNFYIKACVKAEMRKATIYNVYVAIQNHIQVKKMSCHCPGGVQPACCKHSFAVLSALEDYSRKELYNSTTERLQTWHHPKPVKVSPRKFPMSSDTHKPRDISVNLSCLTNHFSPISPIFSVLSVPSTISSSHLPSDVLFYPKTIPLPAFVSPSLCRSTLCDIDMMPNLSDLYNAIFYCEHVRKDIFYCNRLEYKTMNQNSQLWHDERQKRITASNVHSILQSTDLDSTCSNLFINHDRDISSLPPIKLGRTLEPMVKNVLRSKFPNHIFRNTGLSVHPIYPFLGGSPDGLLYNADAPMLVEIKVVFNQAKLSLTEICSKRKDFYLAYNADMGLFSLKKSHKYYFQIQCQLFCTNLNKCLLVVFYKFKQPLFFEVVDADPKFWDQSKMDKLKTFYFQKYLPRYLSRIS